MNQQDFYLQQSRITDPINYTYLFEDVPDDIESICRASRNVINHYFGDLRYKPPKSRWSEIDTRHVSKILERVIELDDRPLTQTRDDDKRFVGCCRDFTVLTIAMMRHKGIPARARYGTASYFEEGYYWDHVIVEYWNGERWIGVDSQLPVEASDEFGFDLRDVPRDKFLVGGRGWQLFREGMDPRIFGLGAKAGGTEFVITEMLLDLAALNREEHLCWEGWGYSDTAYESYTQDDLTLLDEVAAVTQDNDAFEQWRELFTHPKLVIPPQVTSYSPAADPSAYPLTVSIE